MPAKDFSIDSSVPGILKVSGALLFSNAAQALDALSAALPKGRVVTMDLADVEHADSAGLACVLALMARCRKAGGRLQVDALPEGMLALAKVSQVDGLLMDARVAAVT